MSKIVKKSPNAVEHRVIRSSDLKVVCRAISVDSLYESNTAAMASLLSILIGKLDPRTFEVISRVISDITEEVNAQTSRMTTDPLLAKFIPEILCPLSAVVFNTYAIGDRAIMYDHDGVSASTLGFDVELPNYKAGIGSCTFPGFTCSPMRSISELAMRSCHVPQRLRSAFETEVATMVFASERTRDIASMYRSPAFCGPGISSMLNVSGRRRLVESSSRTAVTSIASSSSSSHRRGGPASARGCSTGNAGVGGRIIHKKHGARNSKCTSEFLRSYFVERTTAPATVRMRVGSVGAVGHSIRDEGGLLRAPRIAPPPAPGIKTMTLVEAKAIQKQYATRSENGRSCAFGDRLDWDAGVCRLSTVGVQGASGGGGRGRGGGESAARVWLDALTSERMVPHAVAASVPCECSAELLSMLSRACYVAIAKHSAVRSRGAGGDALDFALLDASLDFAVESACGTISNDSFESTRFAQMVASNESLFSLVSERAGYAMAQIQEYKRWMLQRNRDPLATQQRSPSEERKWAAAFGAARLAFCSRSRQTLLWRFSRVARRCRGGISDTANRAAGCGLVARADLIVTAAALLGHHRCGCNGAAGSLENKRDRPAGDDGDADDGAAEVLVIEPPGSWPCDACLAVDVATLVLGQRQVATGIAVVLEHGKTAVLLPSRRSRCGGLPVSEIGGYRAATDNSPMDSLVVGTMVSILGGSSASRGVVGDCTMVYPFACIAMVACRRAKLAEISRTKRAPRKSGLRAGLAEKRPRRSSTGADDEVEVEEDKDGVEESAAALELCALRVPGYHRRFALWDALMMASVAFLSNSMAALWAAAAAPEHDAITSAAGDVRPCRIQPAVCVPEFAVDSGAASPMCFTQKEWRAMCRHEIDVCTAYWSVYDAVERACSGLQRGHVPWEVARGIVCLVRPMRSWTIDGSAAVQAAADMKRRIDAGCGGRADRAHHTSVAQRELSGMQSNARQRFSCGGGGTATRDLESRTAANCALLLALGDRSACSDRTVLDVLSSLSLERYADDPIGGGGAATPVPLAHRDAIGAGQTAFAGWRAVDDEMPGAPVAYSDESEGAAIPNLPSLAVAFRDEARERGARGIDAVLSLMCTAEEALRRSQRAVGTGGTTNCRAATTVTRLASAMGRDCSRGFVLGIRACDGTTVTTDDHVPIPENPMSEWWSRPIYCDSCWERTAVDRKTARPHEGPESPRGLLPKNSPLMSLLAHHRSGLFVLPHARPGGSDTASLPVQIVKDVCSRHKSGADVAAEAQRRSDDRDLIAMMELERSVLGMSGNCTPYSTK